jgi:hypothetical protein
MKIDIPNIEENGATNFTTPYVTRFAKEEYFNSIEDAINCIKNEYFEDDSDYTLNQKILKINEAIDNIEKSILNNKIIGFLYNDYKHNINYKSILNNMNDIMKAKYEIELQQLIDIHKSNLTQKNNFIKNNKDEIILQLNLIKQNYFDIIKNKKKEYLRNWHEKNKKLLEIQKHKNLTEEEKYINLKKSKKKYYQKKCDEKILLEKMVHNNFIKDGFELIIEKKELTQKEINRKAANKKYYEKKKHNII